MCQWLRLNIYSLLITAGGLSLFAIALAAVLCGMSWLWTLPVFCGAVLVLKSAWIVFGHYGDKCRTMESLKSKLTKGYDQRYFLPYMGTACYRHVVYFTLADSGLASRYSEIRRHYRRFGIQRDKPKTTKFRIVGGRMVFTEESQENSEWAGRSIK